MWENLNQMLVKLAEEYCETTASTFIWGEEEVPECLREQVETTKNN